jgi:pyruvate-formate lyase-activating enzyme
MSDNFCILPFVHLATHPNGDVTPCCESHLLPKNDSKKLDLNSNTIDEIRNSQSFLELKKSFKENRKHKSCNVCWDRESNGIESRRERENKKHGVNQITKGYFIEKQPLLNVELRLGNICNAKCLICQPHSSSKWNEDVDVLKKIKFNVVGDYDRYVIEKEWYRGDDLYSQLINNYETVNHLWFNGGEPTLIKEHYSFLQKLIDVGKSKNITLDYNINGSMVPDELIKIWKHFHHVGVTISLDDIDDRLYYSRFPTTFESVKKSIRKLEKHDITYTLIPTISLLNIFNVVNIYEYFENNFKKGNPPGINFVIHPAFLSINNLSNEHKDKIIKNLEKSTMNKSHIENIIFHLQKKQTHGLGPFKVFINSLDKKRNLDITKYLPEYMDTFSKSNILL